MRVRDRVRGPQVRDEHHRQHYRPPDLQVVVVDSTWSKSGGVLLHPALKVLVLPPNPIESLFNPDHSLFNPPSRSRACATASSLRRRLTRASGASTTTAEHAYRRSRPYSYAYGE